MSIIRTFIAKQLFKKGGAIANSKAVDFSTNALIKRLDNYNIKPTDITSEDQLLRVLSNVKQAEDNVFNNRFKNMLENNKFFNRQSDNVVDLKNKKLDTEKPILGGTQETDQQILKRLKKQNEDSINRLKNKKDPPEELAGGGVAGLLGERRGRIGYARGSSGPLMPMRNLPNVLNQQPFQKAPQTDYSKMMDKQSVYTPFFSGRIKDEFDEKTQTAFDEGAKISNQEFKNEPFDFTKDPFDKQGYSSDIRHGLGTSAFKDAVTDYITSNLGVNADTNLFKGITPENFGSFAANAGSLFTEVPDMFSQAKTVAESKGPYGSIDDYLDEPDTRFLTQPVEDIKANYVGSKIPFSLRNNLEGKKYFIDNFNKYGSNTMNQLKLNQERAMQDQIKKAADKAAAEKSQQQIRQAQTTASAQRNKDSGRGGYQSSFSQDKGFMGGSGTAAEMGSFAEGGPARQNFSMGKRAFLKLLAGTGAGIAGIKSGLLGFGKKEAAKKAVSETVKQAAGSGGQVPPYFLNLVKKIKNLGDDAPRLATQDRQKVTTYKDYTLTEDVTTGQKDIIKKGILDEPDTPEVFMSLKVDDVPVKGKKRSTKVQEYEEFTGKRDYKGDLDVEQGVPDEVVQEGTIFEDTLSEFGKADGGRIGFYEGGDYNRSKMKELADAFARQKYGRTLTDLPDVKRFEMEDLAIKSLSKDIEKKADGGRIGYSAGSKVIGKGIMATINKLFGKGTMTTADKIKIPQKTLDRKMFKNFETKYPETSAADATLNIPVKQEGKFTKAEYLIQRLENTIKGNPNDKYVQDTFPNFIKELKDNPALAKNENVFKELGGDLPKGQQIVVYGDDSIDFFTQKSGPGNIDRIKKIMSKYNISKDKALKIIKMEPNDQVMELKMLEIANRKLNADGGRIGYSAGSRVFQGILKLLKPKPKKSYLEKFPRVDIKELMKGDKPIKLYSGVGDRQANTLKAYKEDAKFFNTTVDKIKKDNFKGQWFTPFKEYASGFGNARNLKSKMLSTELTPKEIRMAKRYVEKVNKKDKMISKMKMEGMDNPPKYRITTDDNTVIIPKIKLKKLKKAGKIDTDYMVLEKIKSKLGLSKGGLAAMLGE